MTSHTAPSAVAGALVTALAVAALVAYFTGWMGVGLLPWLGALAGIGAGAAWIRWCPRPAAMEPPLVFWALVVLGTGAWLAAFAWPLLLPPGGASDLTHHLMLVDVLDRTRHLVDGVAAEAALGEMAHYTPGLHLLVVIASSIAGADPLHATYPLLVLTVALKAGFVFLVAHRVLQGVPARLAMSTAAVAFVLFAPPAYSMDGLLQAGFAAQVAAELFVVAGWWALAWWYESPRRAVMALVGVMGAGTFLTWPIWIGPLAVAAAAAVMTAPGLAPAARAGHAALAGVPAALVAAMHLSEHVAWLRMAGTSGAVPAFSPAAPGWALMALALGGAVAAARLPVARVTSWFAAGLLLQASALYMAAWVQNAETPYMAMKMIYLAVYPAAVLATLALSRLAGVLPAALAPSAARVLAAIVLAVAAALAFRVSAAPPIVSPDLQAAGLRARATLEPACVDYIVGSAETAYWLHLAVMGQPRSSPRTLELDAYSANAAVGRWIEGGSRPYAVAELSLLPGEVLRTVEIVDRFGGAVLIRRLAETGGDECRPKT